MIRIGENDLGIEFVFEPFETNALDRALRSYGHKNRRLYYRAPGSEYPCSSFAITRGHIPVNWAETHFLFPTNDHISGAPIAVSETILPSSFTKRADGVPNIPSLAAVLYPSSRMIGDRSSSSSCAVLSPSENTIRSGSSFPFVISHSRRSSIIFTQCGQVMLQNVISVCLPLK